MDNSRTDFPLSERMLAAGAFPETHMKFRPLLLSLTLLSISACSQAESPVKAADAAMSPDTAKAESAIRASLQATAPRLKINSVRATPLQGIYEIKIEGYGLAYMTADGKYMFQGDLVKLEDKKMINLSESVLAEERKSTLAAIPAKDMIVFPANGQTKAVAYVFTDVDCGYCRKLHSEIADFNKLGIEIRYLAFPRAGYPSPTAQVMDAVWCSANPRQALTDAKKGAPVASPACDSPVRREFELGHQFGVQGTPAVYAADGTSLGGYMPPKAMADALGIK